MLPTLVAEMRTMRPDAAAFGRYRDLHEGPQRQGRFSMSGARSILATTALALILAVPTGLHAQDAGKDAAKPEAIKQEDGKQENGKYAAVPTGTPAAQPIAETRTETPSVTPAQGGGKEMVPTATNGSEP